MQPGKLFIGFLGCFFGSLVCAGHEQAFILVEIGHVQNFAEMIQWAAFLRCKPR